MRYIKKENGIVVAASEIQFDETYKLADEDYELGFDGKLYSETEMKSADYLARKEQFDFEYNKIGIPAPDRVVYLEVDPAVSQGLMTARYQGDESKKDIHEKDLAYLARSHDAADYCARALGWVKVPCTEQGAMRSIEAIHADLLEAIKEVL